MRDPPQPWESSGAADGGDAVEWGRWSEAGHTSRTVNRSADRLEERGGKVSQEEPRAADLRNPQHGAALNEAGTAMEETRFREISEALPGRVYFKVPRDVQGGASDGQHICGAWGELHPGDVSLGLLMRAHTHTRTPIYSLPGSPIHTSFMSLFICDLVTVTLKHKSLGSRHFRRKEKNSNLLITFD